MVYVKSPENCLKKQLMGDGWGYRLGSMGSCVQSGLIETGSALEGVSDTWADVFCADMALEFSLLHKLGGLFAGTAEQQRTA